MDSITDLPDQIRDSLRPVMDSLARTDDSPARKIGTAIGCSVVASIVEGARAILNACILNLGEGRRAAAVFRSLLDLAIKAEEVCDKARLEVASDEDKALRDLIETSAAKVTACRKSFQTTLAQLEYAMRQPPSLPPGWQPPKEGYISIDEVMRDL